ncbi:MAG: sigma-70 family RNA polymerase sigma factor [Phycisphaerae bacterium]|nr:sigma-70 family RNA polymerase sigma factor [Phycisphaerae bacterium]
MPVADSELLLLRKARDGDHGAFHELVDRHARSLYGLAFHLTGNATDAEDVVQETLLGAFRGLAGFREQASVKTWLAQILVRQAAGLYRRERRHKDAQRGDGGDEFDPPVASTQRQAEFQMDLGAALQSLSPEHREVIVLREMQDLTYEEIASVLGVPRGTVESRLHRARRELRQLLEEYVS